jgi:hypothetical protein
VGGWLAAPAALPDARLPWSLWPRQGGQRSAGDWGGVPPEVVAANERRLVHGCRIVSSDPLGEECVWIITAAVRSPTMLLRPLDS